MRILITGSEGQLGLALQRKLADHNLSLVDLPEVDITQRADFLDFAREAKPDLIVHCAAYTDVDGCARDPEVAYHANALGTQNVALAAVELKAEMVHLSTNEVFAGERLDGYAEWMPLCPQNAYGESKAAAEHFVRHLVARAYIVRTAWAYARGGRNFVHAILRHAREHGALRVVTDEVGNPTYMSDVAEAIERLIATHQYGTYHLVNSGVCSRWAFANEILRLSGLDDVTNTPITVSQYKRASTPPRFAALQNNAAAALGIRLRPWQEALAEFLREE